MECLIFSTIKLPGVSEKYIHKITFSFLKFLKKTGSISVHLIGDKKMKKMNNQYRGKNQVTDVLSFSSTEGKEIIKTEELGDIFICIPQIKRQAKENKIKFKEEFARMLAHGILHLLGYDHVGEAKAKKMFGLQEEFVQKLI